jgi:predicted anti-sigma-YlaC factor YlaD
MVELMTTYLEGAMPSDDRARFEAHLGGCDGCTNYFHQIRETVRITGRLTEDQIEPEARQLLLTAFRGWTSGR